MVCSATVTKFGLVKLRSEPSKPLVFLYCLVTKAYKALWRFILETLVFRIDSYVGGVRSPFSGNYLNEDNLNQYNVQVDQPWANVKNERLSLTVIAVDRNEQGLVREL